MAQTMAAPTDPPAEPAQTPALTERGSASERRAAAEGSAASPPRRSLELLYVAVLTLVALGFGLQRIGDNSALLHIRTGLDMVHGSGIPRVDPYSFTAHGQPWVVQSWLPELIYGAALRLGGGQLLLLLNGLLVAALGLLMALLARTGSGVRTLIAGGIAFGLLVEGLSPRPLVVGLLCLALSVTILERRWSPWWHVPVAWVWVNSHGSFPLGIAWLFLVVLGAALDRRQLPRRELRHGGAFLVGLVVAGVNPLGPRLLAFPLTLQDKQSIFKAIIEWRSPDFQSGGGLVMLAFLTLAVVVVARGRLGWVDALPVAFFVGFGLYAVRNLAPAAIVLAPVLGRALRSPEPETDPADGGETADANEPVRAPRRAFDRVLAGLLVVVAVGMLAYGSTFEPFDLEKYPVAVVTAAEAHGWLDEGHRLAHQDVVGNYLAFRFGTSARVFIDDRYDMYPLSVSRDYQALLGANPSAPAVLARYDIDLVLWERKLALVPLLEREGWRPVEGDARWVLLQRPAA